MIRARAQTLDQRLDDAADPAAVDALLATLESLRAEVRALGTLLGVHEQRGAAVREPDPPGFTGHDLTPREAEVAQHVARGRSNPEIARALHLSPRTVEHHVSSILRKLELPSRRALMPTGG